ncbi:serine/threonine protein kinase [Streptomyces sp. MUM 203J]|uniref:serine/threonine protein kinase n=1 Tax=Streptomyces sp. MUM 203J TaxID=2791990 RepID=UPI001F04F408|nr:serine/threonine protein kinase [Streptomyces sp. MUM 203J]MCH0542231.1 serine/threonine protein kinase [Streptomyces sp. MUM 203J]
MDDYAGRVLADRYRLPLPTSDDDPSTGAYDEPYASLVETRAFDSYSGQEVVIRQVPLPETVDAEVVDGDDVQDAYRTYGRGGSQQQARLYGRDRDRGRRAAALDPAVQRAVEAVQAVARIPDHPRLDQVFDVFTEDGSLWIVSEPIAARPLAALLGDRPLGPYRAAEIASDLLTALRALHAHGWTHRNITTRTVLVCDDGRVVLSGLATGAAEEALCGYAPVPPPDDDHGDHDDHDDHGDHDDHDDHGDHGEHGLPELLGDPGSSGDPEEAAAPGGPDTGPDRAPLPLPPAPPALPSGYQPQWVNELADRIADDEDDAQDGSPGRRPDGDAPRALLAGTWRDGPARTGPVPAGGGRSPYGDMPPYGGPRAGLRVDAQRAEARQPEPQGPAVQPLGAPRPYGSASRTPAGRQPPRPASGQGPGQGPEPELRQPAPYRGPATPLAAERARQARIAVVGPVTERWAPEQAGPVHGTWQLAPPVGPATDLWALGALLFRVLQGHAPYPEDSAPELVQMVCAEPPAFAEECGPLRPVVESLLRQDPTERPDYEELRGWLRSLIRSAPEPDAGLSLVPMPSADDTRLPILRRRGDLERRRRARAPEMRREADRPAPRSQPHRHRKARERGPARRNSGSPRALGRTLLLLILLALAGAVAYAVLFMPGKGARDRSQAPAGSTALPTATTPATDPEAGPTESAAQRPAPGGQAPSTNAVTPTAPRLPEGYALRDDPEGFQVAVDRTWRRSPVNEIGQVRYTGGDFTLVVVPGRDTIRTSGADPLEYQREKERELQPWRDSTWASATGLRRIDEGRQSMAEGQFTWQDAGGRNLYVRNLAVLVDDTYHVILAIGPESERDRVTAFHEQATRSYRVTR